MERVVVREDSHGRARYVSPYHVCFEGLKETVLYREREDYDAMVKIICVCARRKEVNVIIYVVVSNHCHIAVLAEDKARATAYGVEVKKMYSMWFRKKYEQTNILGKAGLTVLPLEDNRHIRNTLAYIPRNALDNGYNVNEYRWSGYRAMFLDAQSRNREKDKEQVARLNKREKEKWMHTADDLKTCPWLLDGQKELIPFSFCDYPYLEQAFNHDQSFFLRTIGNITAAEIGFHLEQGSRKTDEEMRLLLEEKSDQLFHLPIVTLTFAQRIRLIQILYRSHRTSVPQLARITGLRREWVAKAVQKPLCRSGENTMPELGEGPQMKP